MFQAKISVYLAEDKQWYRAKILAYSSEERVCVGYLDFGNSEDVDIGHLRPISSSLLEAPMQAIPCALAGCLSSVIWITFNFQYHIVFFRFPEMSFFFFSINESFVNKLVCTVISHSMFEPFRGAAYRGELVRGLYQGLTAKGIQPNVERGDSGST